MPNESVRVADDRLTIISVSLLAYVTQDILHEGLGHGVVAWLSGARHLTLSTLALSSDIDTRLISAAGTIVNLIFAAVFWLLLRRGRKYSPATRYFLVLAMAAGLFVGTGYFLFSGVTNFGDWAAVIRGLQPYWAWRTGLVVSGILAYWASMLIVASALKPFDTGNEPTRRIRALSWIPYISEAVLAAVAGLFNPLGFFYVLSSGLASTAGANAGLWGLPGIIRRKLAPASEQVAPIRRSVGWIVAGAIASAIFILVLGRGVSWNR